MPEILAGFAAITAIIGALWGIILAVKKVVPSLRLAVGILGDIAGEPARPGVPARPGIMERLANIDDKISAQGARIDEHTATLADIHHELHPNSGKSSRDILDRLDRAAAQTPAAQPITIINQAEAA
jgi:hypothetical protein